MSSKAMAWAFEQDLGAGRKFVLVALANNANWNGECSRSYDELAREVGASPRTVQRAIASLIHGGYITVRPQHWDDGRRAPNVYQLNLTGDYVQRPQDGGALS